MEILTKRGIITVIDTHIFEIKIPADIKDLERLVITVGDKSFRIQALIDSGKDVGYDGSGRTAC